MPKKHQDTLGKVLHQLFQPVAMESVNQLIVINENLNNMIKLTNQNYCATVVQITEIIPAENSDSIACAIIMGNQVIVGKDVQIGDIGIFFPVETALSEQYLSANNLYRNKELNNDKSKAGYFEENRRIRCVKFRGNKSDGLFMPLNSLYNLFTIGSDLHGKCDINLKIGESFNEIGSIPICEKYIPKGTKTAGTPNPKSDKKTTKLKNLLIPNQFRLHEETLQLYKNLHKIHPDDLIQISYKMHGSSSIVSNVLVKKDLKWYEKLLIKVGVNILSEEYTFIYSSGKPKSNLPKGIVGFWKNNNGDYYSNDIWKSAYEKLKEFIPKGMSIYSELVGFTENGSAIQKGYDYGQAPGTFGIYIYRITYTNPEGKVFEFSAKQVNDWCKKNGLNSVPELYYGYAKDLIISECHVDVWETMDKSNFGELFLNQCKKKYAEKDCYMCKSKLPEEGCVVRIEGQDLEVFKCKSTRFLENETKQLDKGEIDIESEN